MSDETFFRDYGYPKGSEHWEILRAIWAHGGITSATTEKHGFTRNGMPQRALRELVTRRLVAPRVLTSQPLRIVWQLKETAHDRCVDSQIAREASRLRLREHAKGGFQLDLRRELKRS